jgi:hypothetical protein
MEFFEPFTDNWTYLRTELNWLDQVLGTAVARQRKEVKEVERVARSRADKATSHWWKGLISIEGEVGGDSPADTARRRRTVKISYQQQMEARIQATTQKGITLGLPSLCQRLQLTTFEKNLVLMALAPEISRRYGRIYNYLQDTEQAGGLPTFDLILRLLCRNDGEWRSARLSLSVTSPLIRSGVVVLPALSSEPFLALPIKLTNPIVEYLLADQPQVEQLECLLQPTLQPEADNVTAQSTALSSWRPEQTMLRVGDTQSSSLLQSLTVAATVDRWSDLVLPDSLLQALRHLCDRVQYGSEVDENWGFQQATLAPGAVVLLTGAKGTGKTMAAQAISQTLQIPLTWLDLALINAADYDRLLQEIATQAPKVLLIQSAQIWFGRSAALPAATLQQFLYHRQQQNSLTILTTTQHKLVKPKWQNQLSQILNFPIPDEAARLKLWQQAFPPQVSLGKSIRWNKLAQIVLTGGEIQVIARDAAIIARARSPKPKVTMKHLTQACEMWGIKEADRQCD